jgi:DNA-directed RNA polymerase subunit RPC12/RpoP
MREVIRDPAKTFRCPRCGAPVTYKGRGRRPVWCSARCRVEASIERRGNEIVGLKPEVVKVVSPATRLSDWEKERRQQIERNLDRETVVEMVASRPDLLVGVLARIEEQGLSAPAGDRQILSDAMIRTARSVSPETVDQATASPRPSQKRDASEWVTLLDELTMQLATGLLYNRDLPTLDDPMRNLVDHYLQRVDSSKR